MAYLFIQTWIWLLAAALLGLFIGWLIWRRSGSGSEDCSSIQRQLDECRRKCASLKAAGSVSSTSSTQEFVSGAADTSPSVAIKAENSVGGDKPTFLSAPDGEPDDLKRISGIGKVLEKTLNELGIYHFRQIAEFTRENISWVDNYLSFTGRIDREDWVGQSKKLAAGEATDFANRYDKGDAGQS